MWSIGLDVHWRSFVMHILDERGNRIKEIRGKGGWAKLLEAVRATPVATKSSHTPPNSPGAPTGQRHPGTNRTLPRSKEPRTRVEYDCGFAYPVPARRYTTCPQDTSPLRSS